DRRGMLLGDGPARRPGAGAGRGGRVALERAVRLEVVDRAIDGLQAASAARRLDGCVLIADPARLVIDRRDRAVDSVRDPVRLKGAPAGGEGQLERPGPVLTAPGVPGALTGRLPRGQTLRDGLLEGGPAPPHG